MKKNLSNLLKIKSIITLVVILTMSYMVIIGKEVPVDYAMFGSAIITYFFTKKVETK